jgi:type IV fimbrial biogenesis protein FimT
MMMRTTAKRWTRPAHAIGLARRLAPAGFTLIELMITLSVLAILLGLAAPSISDALLSNKLSGYANNLAGSALVARSEAIKRNAVMTLCVSTDGTTCAAAGGWEQGWIVRCNATTTAPIMCNSAGAGTIVVRREPPAATGITITETIGTLRSLSFQPTGVGTTSSSFTLCRATPVGKVKRMVAISTTGRPLVTSTYGATTCP